MKKRQKMTVTEAWIESLIKDREALVASGQYFDGRERGNIVSFDRRNAGKGNPMDYLPSECNND